MDYQLGLDTLKRLAQGTDWHADFAVHEASLLDNLRDERRYGPSEQSRRDRTRIIDQLNALSLKHTGSSFNDWCQGESSSARSGATARNADAGTERETAAQSITYIDTGGGDYYAASVDTAGGDLVRGDQHKTSGLSAADVARLFESLYTRVEARPDTREQVKETLRAELASVQAEAAKGDAADESFLAQRLRQIGQMAPDILELVTATLTNPAAGFALIVRKVAERIKAAA